MKIAILGAGLAGISAAYFLQSNNRNDGAQNIDRIDIFEQEETAGGLCRSFNAPNGITFDIGPHIFFSKDKETLDFMTTLLGENKHQLKRSNHIIYQDRYVQYPFENDLSKLPKEDVEYCLNAFLNNPYENYAPSNMLQFFLKTFGAGITNLYLRPYNEKIWKYDPAFMDLQMVERIPKPPKEDIIASAAGATTEGYTHQLYFSYPKSGGTQAFINAIIEKLNDNVVIHKNTKVNSVSNNASGGFAVNNTNTVYDKIISTIPANELADIYQNVPANIKENAKALRYNSIAVAVITLSEDFAKNNMGFYIPDSSVIFHRLVKLDYLGSGYHIENTATYMAEVTYRAGDITDQTGDEILLEKIIAGLKQINFIRESTKVLQAAISRHKYAYVIYDLLHKENMSAMRKYFAGEGVYLHGRFGDFEYLNMDTVIAKSKILSEGLKKTTQKKGGGEK